MKRTIIAISRQYGSGGRLVGKALADRLSIPFYDGSSLAPDAHGAEGVPNDEIVKLMERAPENYDASEKLLSYLEKSLMKISSSSCVIAGMAAGYLLRKDPDLITVFITGEISLGKGVLPVVPAFLIIEDIKQLCRCLWLGCFFRRFLCSHISL